MGKHADIVRCGNRDRPVWVGIRLWISPSWPSYFPSAELTRFTSSSRLHEPRVSARKSASPVHTTEALRYWCLCRHHFRLCVAGAFVEISQVPQWFIGFSIRVNLQKDGAFLARQGDSSLAPLPSLTSSPTVSWGQLPGDSLHSVCLWVCL